MVLVWSFDTNEVHEVAMANFYLNKSPKSKRRPNGCIYGGRGGEFRGPWWRGPKSTLSLVSPHIRTLKIAYTYVFRNYMGLAR